VQSCCVVLFIVMLNIDMLSIITLSTDMLSIITLSVFMVSIIILGVIMLNLVMLNIVMLSAVLLNADLYKTEQALIKARFQICFCTKLPKLVGKTREKKMKAPTNNLISQSREH